MNPVTLVLLGAGLFFGYRLFAAGRVSDNLTVNLVDFAFNFAGLQSSLRLVLQVVNPTAQQLVITSLSATVEANTYKVGNINVLQPITIAPRSEQRVEVPVQMTAVGLTQLLASLGLSALTTRSTPGEGRTSALPPAAQFLVEAIGFPPIKLQVVGQAFAGSLAFPFTLTLTK